MSSYFRANGPDEIGRGRASSHLLDHFAPYGMTMARGMTDQDQHAAVRRDVCQFADERLSDAQKLAFVHQLLQRPMGQAQPYLDRMQRYATGLNDPVRQTPGLALALALADVARDAAARARFLAYARDADQPAGRVRMLTLARDLGWLTEDERWQELALMLGEVQARGVVGVSEVDLACMLNRDHDLDGAFNRRLAPGSPADDVVHAAVRACLGSAEGHARTLQALIGQDDNDVQMARAYLRNRPITDAVELRHIAAGIARQRPSDAQVHALEVLGRHYVSDRGIMDLLIDLYAQTSSAAVQAAIAGILMRADQRSIAGPQLQGILVAARLPPPAGDDMVDALIRRLKSR